MNKQFASSQQEKQPNKSNESISLDSQTNWQQLETMNDSEIDLSDIPELTEAQLKHAKPFRQFLSERGVDYDASAPATLVVYHEDGHSSTHQLAPVSNVIVLDDDVLRYFHDSETVNRTLRALIQLVPEPA